MTLLAGPHERAALEFDDVASALDAGLPLDAVGADERRGDEVLLSIFERRNVALTPTERTTLVAAWQSGNAPVALRRRAAHRRSKAEFVRKVWAAIRYPLLVMGMTVVASLATMAVVGNANVPLGLAVFLALLGLGGCWLRHVLRHGGESWFRIPGIGATFRDYGEIPYLETLHALYGAGVRLPDAHRAAMAAVPFAAVRARLAVADRALADGRTLSEGLAAGLGLHAESRNLLATGERSGQLEDALDRAAKRRRECATVATERLVRTFASVFYGAAVVAAVIVILSFYGRIAQFYRR